jgi:hypothetical protein
MACSHRAAVVPDETGPTVPDLGADVLLLPDGPLGDLGLPEVCRGDQVPWTLHKDPRGNFSLVAQQGIAVTHVKVANAGAAESAAALNFTGVAGLVVTRSTGAANPAQEVATIQQQLLLALGGKGFAQRASGSTGTSAEGFPAVKDVIWDITSTTEVEPGSIRNLVMAAALSRSVSALSNLPGPVTTASHKQVVKMTVTLRPGQAAVTAAVANLADYENTDSSLAFMVDDLSNGTAVAKAGKQPVFECDIQAISSKPVADIIWIVDESGSMNDNRQDIVNNANKFFSKAIAAGLDFRMGVAGMKKPGAGVELGKFCSDGHGAASDDGGEDRFLLPHEQDTFSACVKNPPYYEGGSEHGLSHGYHAVKRHLPRAPSSPNRVRTNAHLAVIYVTDETAQELKEGSGSFFGVNGFLSYQDYKKTSCQLTSAKQAQMEAFLKPLFELYTTAEAKIHLIGGTCQNSCNAEIAYGYRELVDGFSGQVGEVCQHDLSATLQVIIDTINASASPRTLKYIPISSTLAVEAQGLRLKRSRVQGYIYNASSNSLTFINVKMPKGAVVVASYRRFK